MPATYRYRVIIKFPNRDDLKEEEVTGFETLENVVAASSQSASLAATTFNVEERETVRLKCKLWPRNGRGKPLTSTRVCAFTEENISTVCVLSMKEMVKRVAERENRRQPQEPVVHESVKDKIIFAQQNVAEMSRELMPYAMRVGHAVKTNNWAPLINFFLQQTKVTETTTQAAVQVSGEPENKRLSASAGSGITPENGQTSEVGGGGGGSEVASPPPPRPVLRLPAQIGQLLQGELGQFLTEFSQRPEGLKLLKYAVKNQSTLKEQIVMLAGMIDD